MFSVIEKLTVNIPYVSSEKLIGTSRDSNPRPPFDSRMPELLGYRSLNLTITTYIINAKVGMFGRFDVQMFVTQSRLNGSNDLDGIWHENSL
jgi:hypothetical protein